MTFAHDGKSRFRIGVDVGGTFTDLVAFDEETGQTILVKTHSTPRDPSTGVLASIEELLSKHPGHIQLIVHASTVGTNLFLGQMGLDIPRGALVTTQGFRDVIEIGRQKRPELYNLFFQRPRPLIERELRFGVDERISFKGEILKPLSEPEVRKLAGQLKEQSIETVAVVFLHSYANPSHEQRVREILEQELPQAVVVTSHEVDPSYREYERTSTTVINSLLIPVVSRYLENLRDRLREREVDAPLYVMQSNGGLATVDVASNLPVATIESGPATGVTAAAEWGRLLDKRRILSFDMGGTTAKAGLVIDGTPQMVGECEIGGTVHGGRTVTGSGYPVRFPFIDLAEVSGGGGTIAWIDQGNALMVGPTSAGADPGPACYGRGGRNPTVTDANLVLGRLGTAGLSGGTVELFPELAQAAIADLIARPLGISVPEAAHGILEIVNTHMMRALRLVSIERGYDPREFTMLAFGGAGPMHAAFLAEGMGIAEIIVPPNSGVFSALGLLLADFRHDFKTSVMQPSSHLSDTTLAATFSDLQREAESLLASEGFPPERITIAKSLDIRYVGQSYELPIPMKAALKQTVRAFHSRHEQVYGYAPRSEPTEVVSAHLIASGATPKPVFERATASYRMPATNALVERRSAYFYRTGWIETPVYARPLLLTGNWIDGPALVEQYDATTVIPPGWSAEVDGLANLRLERRP